MLRIITNSGDCKELCKVFASVRYVLHCIPFHVYSDLARLRSFHSHAYVALMAESRRQRRLEKERRKKQVLKNARYRAKKLLKNHQQVLKNVRYRAKKQCER